MPSGFLAEPEPAPSSLRPLLCFLLQDSKGSHAKPTQNLPVASGFESGRHRLSVQMPWLRHMGLAVLLYTLACRMRSQEASVCGQLPVGRLICPFASVCQEQFPFPQFGLIPALLAVARGGPQCVRLFIHLPEVPGLPGGQGAQSCPGARKV